MKIISWNANKLKSIFEKGFFDFLEKENPEIVCLQKIKTQALSEMKIKDYFAYFNRAKRRGMVGTAVLTKKKPLNVEKKIGFKRFDSEGRFLRVDFKDFLLINVYLPHGGREKENMGYKLKAFKELRKYLKKISNQKVILAGNFNVAHKEIDLARPKENKESAMFTLPEREQIEKIIKLGLVDSFRQFNKKGGNFTWWPPSFDTRKRNLGWRIDYIFVSKTLLPRLKDAFILKEILGSDHCPIGIEII